MAKKTEATVVVPTEKPSLETFRAAIQHVLMKEHGSPKLVAEALLELEGDYIRSILDGVWDEDGKKASLVFDVAAEIAIREPTNSGKWIFVEEGSVLLDISDQAGTYLDALVDLGLHGGTRHKVAEAMMARGIESVFHLLPATSQSRKR